jgi:hypothetical protein
VAPAVTLAVPRPIAVIVVPIGSKHEGDYRYADLDAVAGYQYELAAILFLQIAARHPSSIVTDLNVTP